MNATGRIHIEAAGRTHARAMSRLSTEGGDSTGFELLDIEEITRPWIRNT